MAVTKPSEAEMPARNSSPNVMPHRRVRAAIPRRWYMEDGKTPVTWVFSTMPSEEWKNGVGSALTAYAADQTDENWDAVVKAFVDGWAAEAAAAK